MSVGRGIDKDNVIHTYNGMLLGHKKERSSEALLQCGSILKTRGVNYTEGHISYDSTCIKHPEQANLWR